ncbi:MAG: DEAD/DEAH box helicase [Gammaproteobacteria bacterium]|nr:DEAD/DEAH box helicase [Gammaproteobacteria bacterium]
MDDLFTPPAPPVLRDYQRDALDRIDAAFDAGHRAPLLVLPTGSGKTVIAAELMRREVAAGRRVLFLAPRRELVDQARRKLAAAGVYTGVILAGMDHLRDPDALAQVASIDTLLARVARGRVSHVPARVDSLIVDEAHLSITAVRRELFDRWPDARRVGLTATPTRKDGRALGALYDALIEPVTVAALTEAGHLVPGRYFSVSEPDLRRVRTVAGEYHAADLDAAVNRPELVGDIVAHWLRHASDRRSVVFASSIAHSVALAEAFQRVGVAAEHVDATTPTGERDEIFGRYRAGETQLLANCFLASYGFDLPALSCVVLARPTKSLMLYLQMLGRGLRPADGKADCLILDHSGAVHRHGFAADARAWTLDGTHALVRATAGTRDANEPAMIDCPDCRAVFSGTRTCPECGWTLKPRGRDVVTLVGELVELGARRAESIDRERFYLELLGYAAEHGHQPGSAAHRYRERFGEFPPWRWRTQPPITPTLATRRWVRSRQIAYAKARSAHA